MTDTLADEAGYFDAAHSAEVVNARMAEGTDPRLRQIMTVLVRHLHAAVKEVGLTTAEWEQGIRFLTETGHMCTDWRQEFILLSDILGLSMLVDSIDHDRPAGATENTVLGPFFVAGAPSYPNGANICLDGMGEPLAVRGRVTDEQGRPVADAVLDVWAANEDGFYDVQQKGIQPDNNLRGRFRTDADGRYWFRTVKPRYYPIPDDGPVGKLLAALGRRPYRPAHLHFIVQAPGFDTVVTHIFTPDCPYLGEDPVFGVKQSLIAEFGRSDDPAAAAALGFPVPFSTVEWDFTLVSTTEAE